MSHTDAFFKKQYWLWPIVAIVLLLIVALYVSNAIESTMQANLQSQMQTLLAAETAMLQKWYEGQAHNAEGVTSDLEFREAVYTLVETAESGDPLGEPADTQSIIRAITKDLSPMMASHDYPGYFIADKSKRIVAASSPGLIGQQGIREFDRFLSSALDGESAVSPPFRSVVLQSGSDGQIRAGAPTMYVCSPIRDPGFQVIGALALQIAPDHEFTEILQLGRMGESGETYAINKQGEMVSNSRFDDQLILLGILPDQPDARSMLNVLVSDPKGDMTSGFRPGIRRSEMPLTHMALDVTSGNSGVNVTGYRDYRGVQVVGAWEWLPQYEIGVATEIDQAEAFRPLIILRWTFWSLYALLATAALAIFIFTLIVARLQKKAQKAAIEAQQLGQYTLEQQLGSGAMGVVYKGQHAMLRRPTAIKLLDAEAMNDASIARFEREVQITCKLNHPNTIAIYDFGRTPEGVFYYAMEFIDGIDLQELVDQCGPQPGGRVIEILLQACGSLFEAHSQGLVHRDVKPANLMLSFRGGEPDVLKVLDFGLVKTIDDQQQSQSSAGAGLTGTPLYMSPEAIQTPLSVDGRSDLYGLGAIGYFLLTGSPVFEAANVHDLCHKQVDETPEPPSKKLGKKISSQLENALLRCLEKSRAKRPQTAREFADLLKQCPEYGSWSLTHADAWWRNHDRGDTTASDQTDPPASPSAQTIQNQTMVIDEG